MIMRSVKNRVSALGGTFVPLLAALLIVLVIAPVAGHWPLVSSILVTCLLIAGLFAFHRHPLLRRGMFVAVVIVLGLRWLSQLYGEEHTVLVVVSHSALVVYMGLLCAVCVDAVLRREQITRDTILGAVCGYILIAYVFTFGYAILEDINPGNFSSSVLLNDYDGAKIGHGTPELLYYSFVTLTTVGFGDIVPATRVARSLAILEMLIGQLYLAAFVARLVGVMSATRGGSGAESSLTDGP
jgi:hypothetical protein